MSTWERRKERIKNDPEFRRRVYGQQSASRARRRKAEAESKVAPCPHVYGDGRRCWQIATHTHGPRPKGELTDTPGV